MATLSHQTRLYRCTVCNKIDFYGQNWSHYTNQNLEDNASCLAIYCCSATCQDMAIEKVASGAWRLPKVTQRGYISTVTRDQKGYRAQPDQKTLRAAFARLQAPTR